MDKTTQERISCFFFILAIIFSVVFFKTRTKKADDNAMRKMEVCNARHYTFQECRDNWNKIELEK